VDPPTLVADMSSAEPRGLIMLIDQIASTADATTTTPRFD